MIKTKYDIPTKLDCPGIADIMVENGYYGNKSKKEIIIILENEIYEKKFIIAKKENEIIGYSIFISAKGQLREAGLELNPKYAYSKGIAIKKAYAGRDEGKKLKQITMNWAKKQGFKGMYTDVGLTNTRSISMQISCGFEQVAKYDTPSRAKQGGQNLVFAIEF